MQSLHSQLLRSHVSILFNLQDLIIRPMYHLHMSVNTPSIGDNAPGLKHGLHMIQRRFPENAKALDPVLLACMWRTCVRK
jgi:hypothetical protein